MPHLDLIGAPSSAGAYAPGQEQTPRAVRDAGLLDALEAHGWQVDDHGDTDQRRWRPDRQNRRAMNAPAVADNARQLSAQVRAAWRGDPTRLLVLGGDCTCEIGTVAGVIASVPDPDRVGLIYIDHDTDLNTPQSTTEGALDWMGVAHLLALPDTVPALTGVGARTPLLRPEQVLLFANASSTAFERGVIEGRGGVGSVQEIPHQQVDADPVAAAERALEWARGFDHLLIHVDIDVVDFADTPLAENTRRNTGITLRTLVAALEVLVGAPTWRALTVCELNPDHGEPDGSTLRRWVLDLATVLSHAIR